MATDRKIYTLPPMRQPGQAEQDPALREQESPGPHMSRREFIGNGVRLIYYGALAAAAARYAPEIVKEFSAEKEGTVMRAADNNVATVKTSEATYRIFYTEPGLEAEADPLNVDALIVQDAWTDILKDAGTYRDDAEETYSNAMLRKAAMLELPAYLTDPELRHGSRIASYEGAAKYIPPAAALAALTGPAIYQGIAQNEIVQRRQVIKAITAGVLAITALPIISDFVLDRRYDRGRGGAGRFAKAIDTLEPHIHPITRDVRNAVTAEKAKHIARTISREKGGHPSIGIIVDRMRVGIEDRLRLESSHNIGFLEGHKPEIRKHIEPESLSIIRKYHFDGERYSLDSKDTQFPIEVALR